MATATNAARGHVPGQPVRFLLGHNRRKTQPGYTVEDCGHDTECWIWRPTTRFGYGRLWADGSYRPAHRWFYERAHGPVPEGLELDHLCRNRSCVNPDHLEAVTHHENLLRGRTVAALNAAKTHCPRGHEYNAENTRVTSQGARVCRVCAREKRRKQAA